MGIKVFCVFTLLVSILTISQAVPFAATGKVAGKAFNVMSLGSKLLKHIKTSDTDVDFNELVGTLAARIDASTTKLITTVLLQSKLERINEAVISIHTSLIDLQRALLATTPEGRTKAMDLFVSRFNEHDVIKHLRFLPELLDYIGPGTSGKLVDLFAENTRCNMTAVYEFELFYFQLLSDGIALELVYLKTLDMDIEHAYEFWESNVNETNRIFNTLEERCIDQFSKYAKEDIQAADSASTLWRNSKERYPWKTCDVIFLKKYGTFQFLYMKHTEDTLFYDMESSKRKKIAIFIDKTEIKANVSLISETKNDCKSAIQGKDDKEAAKNVGICVENHFNDLGYNLSALLVFFDGDDFSPEAVIIDKNSSQLSVSFDDVASRFCYESGFQCTMDVFNWFDGTKTFVGKMRVFAYVRSSPAKQYKYASGSRITCFEKLFYFVISFGIVFLT